MEELQKLNPEPETATDSMVMLLALNTASVQIIPPLTLIAIIGIETNTVYFPILFTTLGSLVVAVVAAKALGRLRRFRETDPLRNGLRGRERRAKRPRPAHPVRAGVARPPDHPRPSPLTRNPSLFWTPSASSSASPPCSSSPAMIVGIPIYGLVKRVAGLRVVRGVAARRGFSVAVRDHPVPRGHPVRDRDVPGVGRDGVAVRRARARALALVGMPAEVLPIGDRPPRSRGPARSPSWPTSPSSTGRTRSSPGWRRPMFGSTETTFYVVAVYFGAVGVSKTRHAVPAGLIADVSAMLFAVWLCLLFFG